jgi:dTDP-4-dehydrorhamnose 3,5-epimerase
MKVSETLLPGVLIVDVEPITDARGMFARSWDRGELAARGLSDRIEQVNIAFNEVAGTLRGLHFQASPHGEAKTVRCTAGAIFDVAVDLRQGSPTRHRWVGVELSAASRRSLFIPEGCAHGYVTLTDEVEVQYQMSTGYRPEAARGYRWDDPAFGIEWPIPISRISDRDATLPYIEVSEGVARDPIAS